MAGKLAVVEQAVKLTFKTFCIPDDMVMFKRVSKVIMILASSVVLSAEADKSRLIQIMKDGISQISQIEGDEVFRFRYAVLFAKELLHRQLLRD